VVPASGHPRDTHWCPKHAFTQGFDPSEQTLAQDAPVLGGQSEAWLHQIWPSITAAPGQLRGTQTWVTHSRAHGFVPSLQVAAQAPPPVAGQSDDWLHGPPVLPSASLKASGDASVCIPLPSGPPSAGPVSGEELHAMPPATARTTPIETILICTFGYAAIVPACRPHFYGQVTKACVPRCASRASNLPQQPATWRGELD
jgi:hypothetical protein